MSRPSFNLVTEPWVPVEDMNASLREVSLTELFESAQHLRRIVDPSPLVSAALYRLAFAIAHCAFRPRNDEDWEEAWDAGFVAQRVVPYLVRNKDRFDLFSETAPFYQVVDMPDGCRPYPWTKLALEFPTDHGKLLFDHTSALDPPVASPAKVARALVAAQAFIVGAGKSCMGYTVHAPLASALTVIPEGRDIAETVLANLMPLGGPDDKPIWELPPLVATQVEAQQGLRAWTGPASRLTWLPRAVQLIPENDAGEVRWIRFGMGFKTPVIDGDRDPWVAYRITKDGRRVARKLDADRMIWRDLHGMLASSTDGESDPVQALTRLGLLADAERQAPTTWTVLVAGLLADKASVKAWRQERWRLPDTLLQDRSRRQKLASALEMAEGYGTQLKGCAWSTAVEQLGGSDKADWQQAARIAEALPTVGSYWAPLEGDFQQFLFVLGNDPENALPSWRAAIAGAIAGSGRSTHAALGRDAAALRVWAKVGWRFDRLIATVKNEKREPKEAAEEGRHDGESS